MSVLPYSRHPIPLYEKSFETLENHDCEQNPDCKHGQTSSCGHHNGCRHNIQLLLPAMLVLLVLGFFLAWRCVNRHDFLNEGFEDLMTRGLLTGYSLNPKTAFSPQFLWFTLHWLIPAVLLAILVLVLMTCGKDLEICCGTCCLLEAFCNNKRK